VQKDSSSLDPAPKKGQPQLKVVNENKTKNKKSASPMFVKVNLLLERNVANKENIPSSNCQLKKVNRVIFWKNPFYKIETNLGCNNSIKKRTF